MAAKRVSRSAERDQRLWVSPAGSVGASAFGRGVHRTPTPLDSAAFVKAGETYVFS